MFRSLIQEKLPALRDTRALFLVGDHTFAVLAAHAIVQHIFRIQRLNGVQTLACSLRTASA